MPTDPVARTTNPPEFEQAVEAYLEHAREQFNYEQMLLTFRSTERFHLWAVIVAHHRSLRGARMLSSGCGFGGSLLAYRDAGAQVAVGVEVDDDFARFAALRTSRLDGAGAVRYDGTRLPFPPASFDVIESMDVIEHTPDPLAYLRELGRVLAPGGVVLLVTPNRLWPVEQHLGFAGPPWLPVGVADVLFTFLSRLPLLSKDRRFRYARLRGMRTQNLSLRRLQRVARQSGMFLRLVRPADHADGWPLPRQGAWVERMLDHRLGKFFAPARTIVTVLTRTGDEAYHR
jgi:SAM-dependent methyltransferase